jgi:hypothetical protein
MENEFSTYRIAYALSKLHLWNSLLKLYFLFSAIAHQKKAPASILFGYSGDRLCPKTHPIFNLGWQLQKYIESLHQLSRYEIINYALFRVLH